MKAPDSVLNLLHDSSLFAMAQLRVHRSPLITFMMS